MTDLMRRLAAARPETLDPAPSPERRHRDLAAALNHAAEPRTKRSLHLGGRRAFMVGLGLVAAGTAAALVVTTGGQGTPESPATPGGESPQRLGGKEVLLAAATKAEQQRLGKFWFSNQVTSQSYLVRAKSGDYAIAGAVWETYEWTSAKSGGGNLFYGRDLPARPLTKADEVAWRKAGKPKSFRVWSNDHYETYTGKLGRWEADKPQAKPGGRFQLPGFSKQQGATVEQLRALPTDPEQLAKIFFDQQPGEVRLPASPAHDVMGVAHALREAPLPPKVRAGLMRALASRPGIRAVGTMTDALGRQGVALVGDWPEGGEFDRGYGSKQVIIFSKNTGEVLSDQDVLTRPGGIYRKAKPGFVISAWSLRGSGWVDKKPSPPASPPFH